MFFEVGGSKKDKAAEASSFFVQFITRYLHSEGSFRVRVTTFARRWAAAGF